MMHLRVTPAEFAEIVGHLRTAREAVDAATSLIECAHKFALQVEREHGQALRAAAEERDALRADNERLVKALERAMERREKESIP